MLEWTHKCHQLLISQKFLTQNIIKLSISECIEHNKVKLRKFVIDFIELCYVNQIPILVFSAGIKSVVQGVLEYYSTPNPQILSHLKILSNKCNFSVETDLIESFDEPTIHVYSKKSSHFLNSKDYFTSKVESTHENVLLIGDSTGDVNMIEGMNYKSVIKIGFLNDKVDERLELYLSLYDIIIIGNDIGFEIPVYLLSLISESLQ